jgi:hypothetical protein
MLMSGQVEQIRQIRTNTCAAAAGRMLDLVTQVVAASGLRRCLAVCRALLRSTGVSLDSEQEVSAHVRSRNSSLAAQYASSMPACAMHSSSSSSNGVVEEQLGMASR